MGGPTRRRALGPHAVRRVVEAPGGRPTRPSCGRSGGLWIPLDRLRHPASMSGSEGRACQHSPDGGRGGRRGAPLAAAVVVPGALCPARGKAQRRDALGVPLRLLRGPAPPRQSPGRGQLPRPHQHRLSGPRRAPRGRRPRRLHPTHPRRTTPRRPPETPALPDQHVHPGLEPRLPRWHGPRSRPRLPPAHPVRRLGLGCRLRPRHPGHRLRRGPQCHLLVLAGGVPRHPRLPRTVQPPRWPVPIGLDPGHRGRRGRRRPARGLRWPVLPADPGTGTGQSGGAPGGRADQVPRRRPHDRAGRAAGRALCCAHGGPLPHSPSHRLGGSQLAPRRRLTVGLRRRLQPLHLTDRPADGVRAGQHLGRHPGHPGRARRSRVRPGLDDHRLRPDRGPGPLGRARLPCRELLAPHPLRRPGLRLPRVRATSELPEAAGIPPPPHQPPTERALGDDHRHRDPGPGDGRAG